MQKVSSLSDAYMRRQSRPPLFQIIAFRLYCTKPLSEPMLEYCQLDAEEQSSIKFNHNLNIFIHQNAFESVVCEIVAILSQPQCVNDLGTVISSLTKMMIIMYQYIFSCDQAALWMVQSVCLSICLSFTMFPSSKGQGQRSNVKVTEVKTQLNRFRTVTPVWIHIWWWNDAHSLVLLRRGALLSFKVIRQISRSHSSNNHRIWPRLGVSGL